MDMRYSNHSMNFSDGNGLGDWIPPSIDSNEEKDEGEQTIQFKRRKVDFDPEE